MKISNLFYKSEVTNNLYIKRLFNKSILRLKINVKEIFDWHFCACSISCYETYLVDSENRPLHIYRKHLTIYKKNSFSKGTYSYLSHVNND